MRRLLAVATGLGLVFSIVSCASDPTKGYSPMSVYPSNIKTVAVPIFTSKAYSRDIEFDLTDALIKEIESRTPYKITAEAGADTVLLGQVREVKLDQLSKSRTTGLAEEMIVSVTIDFQWKDFRNGKVLLDRKSFAGHGLFVPSRPTGEPIELGRLAAVQQLARDIVGELQAEW